MDYKRNPFSSLTYCRLIINGLDGGYFFGALGRKIMKGLTMKELGESVGVCMHAQTADGIAMELADIEIEKGSKKKKDELQQQIKKDKNLSDVTRALIFKDGVCVSSADQMDKDKAILNSKLICLCNTNGIEDGTYYIVLGADGPCQISINLGGKIFRSHHDELEKGVISGATSLSNLKKQADKNFSR